MLLPTIPTRAKVAATLSLVLWFGVLTMGRLIGYYEPKRPETQAPSRPAFSLASTSD